MGNIGNRRETTDGKHCRWLGREGNKGIQNEAFTRAAQTALTPPGPAQLVDARRTIGSELDHRSRVTPARLDCFFRVFRGSISSPDWVAGDARAGNVVFFCSAEIESLRIRCQSSFEFDRLRPFPIIHRLFAFILRFLAVFEFDQVRQTSIMKHSVSPPQKRTEPSASSFVSFSCFRTFVLS